MQSGVDAGATIGNGIVIANRVRPYCTLSRLYQGYETQATRPASPTRRSAGVTPLWRLSMDFVLKALMFSTPYISDRDEQKSTEVLVGI